VTRFDTAFTAEIAVRESKNVARTTGVFSIAFFDRVNIRFRCAFEPRGVHAQHYLDAVSVLLRDPEMVALADGERLRALAGAV
jgi:hypothetical protein